MIAISQSVKYNINDGGNLLGQIVVSDFIKSTQKYKVPFIKISKQILVKVGTGDYDDFDSFIVSSLNDYYNKITKDTINREENIENYTKLYSLWSKICECKENDNAVKLNELYNKISYGLYLLGYEDKQL